MGCAGLRRADASLLGLAGGAYRNVMMALLENQKHVMESRENDVLRPNAASLYPYTCRLNAISHIPYLDSKLTAALAGGLSSGLVLVIHTVSSAESERWVRLFI